MKHTRRILVLLSFLGLIATSSSAFARLKVVTTTQDPAAITRAIGGSRVKVDALCAGSQDPHYLDAKPSYVVKLSRADLLIAIGLDLEAGYLPSILAGARNDRIQPGQTGFLDLSTAIQPLEAGATADRSQGDVHPLGNPHYWLDPHNGAIMADAIAARLIQLDPQGKADYEKNLAAFKTQLNRKIEEWAHKMAPFRGHNLVTYHRSWSYFVERYGLHVVGYVEPRPGIPPSATHTLKLIKLIPANHVKLILMENFYNPKVPRLLAKKTGAKVAVVPSSVEGEKGVDTYFDLIDRIVDTIVKTWKI